MNVSRRNFLRGLGGSTLALPWLPSLAAGAQPPSAKKPPLRMAHFYVPIGVVRSGFFYQSQHAASKAKGRGQGESNPLGESPGKVQVRQLDELTPTISPLEDVKQHINLITGLDRVFQEGTDAHAQCASCYLSSAKPYSLKESAWPLDRTLDHIVADHIGTKTPLRTLEISCNNHQDNKETIYFDNISWYGTGHVAPSIRNPRQLYRRLFSTRSSGRFRNVTDLVLEDARGLKRVLGTRDREKLNEYFDSVRAIETQMDRLEAMKATLSKVGFEEPAESHMPRADYIRVMGDLMITALQTGLTNVATLMVGPERWDTPYVYDGLLDVPQSHHHMSHNQDKLKDDLLKIDHFHMQQYAYLVGRMLEIKEADGSSMLDNTLFTYGSGLGDGKTHQYNDLPIIVSGGGSRLKTGRHINMPDGTPLANLWLTQARLCGAELETFADSTGYIDL